MEPLTARQQQVLDFINESQSQTGVIPTSREIQQHFGFGSQTAAMNHLKALERKGVIHRQPGKARAVSVLANLPRQPIANIPIFGSIVAGMAEAVEQEEIGTEEKTDRPCSTGDEENAVEEADDARQGQHHPEPLSSQRTMGKQFGSKNRPVAVSCRIGVAFRHGT